MADATYVVGPARKNQGWLPFTRDVYGSSRFDPTAGLLGQMILGVGNAANDIGGMLYGDRRVDPRRVTSGMLDLAMTASPISRMAGPTGGVVLGSMVGPKAGKPPKKKQKAYKLFKVKRGKDGEADKLYPLYVDAAEEVPQGKWIRAGEGVKTDAGKVKSKLGPLAYRPGWHAGDLPTARHIGGKVDPKTGKRDKTLKQPNVREDDTVWAEVEFSADTDWQSVANQRAARNKAGDIIPRTAQIADQVPYGGFYRYKTNPNMEGEWLVGGDMKVNRILDDAEVKKINDAAGRADLPRASELTAPPAPGLLQSVGGSSYDDAVKLGAGRMGVSEDAFDAMARQGRVAPQIAPVSSKTGREVGFQPGYSKGLKPKVEVINEMDAGLARDQIIRPNKTIEAEGLLGKVLVPMPGDRTSRDTVTAMMGRKIDPEVLEGGYPYMADMGGWASGDSVISAYKNIFDDLGGRGVGVGKVMSGTGSDYSRMSTDLMYKAYDMEGMPKATKAALKKEVNIEIDQANAAAIKKAKQKAIDEGRPYEEPKIQKPFKGFDKNTKELLDKDPALRKAVMGALDKDRSRKLPGAPDAIAIRHAITADKFRDLRRGDPDPLSGFDFMSFPAGGKITPANHKSYSDHLGGEYLGGLSGGPVPTTVLFPDFAKEMAKEGRPLSQYNYMFDRNKPTQEVDERVVQGILDYYASLRN